MLHGITVFLISNIDRQRGFDIVRKRVPEFDGGGEK